jgi:hypothetical protein
LTVPNVGTSDIGGALAGDADTGTLPSLMEPKLRAGVAREKR